MVNIGAILTYTESCAYLIAAIISVCYGIPILLVKTFRHRINILTANTSLGIMICSLFWIVFALMFQYDLMSLYAESRCNLLHCSIEFCTNSLTMSTVTISINQYLAVVHNKRRFFQTNQFLAISIGTQWVVTILLAVPISQVPLPYCNLPRWIWYYITVTVVALPGLLCLIFNILIFVHARSSSRRVTPSTQTAGNGHSQGGLGGCSRRDMRLLRHTMIMLAIFTLSWSPIFITTIMSYDIEVPFFIFGIFQLWASLGIISFAIVLLKYNRELNEFQKARILQLWRILQCRS